MTSFQFSFTEVSVSQVKKHNCKICLTGHSQGDNCSVSSVKFLPIYLTVSTNLTDVVSGGRVDVGCKNTSKVLDPEVCT
jgi:hypothetical protein